MKELAILLCKVSQITFQEDKMIVYVGDQSMQWLFTENVFNLAARVASDLQVSDLVFVNIAQSAK